MTTHIPTYEPGPYSWYVACSCGWYDTAEYDDIARRRFAEHTDRAVVEEEEAVEAAEDIVEQARIEALIRANENAALRAGWQAVRRGW